MVEEFTITEKMLEVCQTMSFQEKVHYMAVLTLLEKYGITAATLEKWGKKEGNHQTLLIPVSKVTEEPIHGGIAQKNYRSIQIHLS